MKVFAPRGLLTLSLTALTTLGCGRAFSADNRPALLDPAKHQQDWNRVAEGHVRAVQTFGSEAPQ